MFSFFKFNKHLINISLQSQNGDRKFVKEMGEDCQQRPTVISQIEIVSILT